MQFFPSGSVITLKGDFKIMNTTTDIQGIRTIIYPVKDIAQAKALYSRLLGQVYHDLRDVGGGKQIASVKDADCNIIGLIQLP